MIDLIQGIFISLLVGLIILVIQFIENKKKDLFFTITYCQNISYILEYNKRALKDADEIYSKYFNTQNWYIEFNTNTEYTYLEEYLKIHYYKLLSLPKIQPNIINIKFLDFFLDNGRYSPDEVYEVITEANERAIKIKEEGKTDLGVYGTLYGCILKFNENLLKIYNLFEKYSVIEIESDSLKKKRIELLMVNTFTDYKFIMVNLERMDELFSKEIELSYKELKKINKNYMVIKILLVVCLLVFSIILIA